MAFFGEGHSKAFESFVTFLASIGSYAAVGRYCIVLRHDLQEQRIYLLTESNLELHHRIIS